MNVVVLTTSEIEVFKTSHTHPDKIDGEVERKYGRQLNGLPHKWTGVYSIKQVQETLRGFLQQGR